MLTTNRFGHDMVNCKKPCIKILECEHKHKCLEECYLPCRCACTENRGRPADRTPSPIKLPPLPRQDSLPEDRTPLTGRTQAFRDFAEGGHIESDANFAAMLESQLDLQKADDAMASALFGGGIAEPQKVTLVRTASDANGTSRGIWKGVYGKEEAEVDGAKDETPSLLD